MNTSEWIITLVVLIVIALCAGALIGLRIARRPDRFELWH